MSFLAEQRSKSSSDLVVSSVFFESSKIKRTVQRNRLQCYKTEALVSRNAPESKKTCVGLYKFVSLSFSEV